MFLKTLGTCSNYYGLDPVYSYTLPNVAFEAMLKLTGIEIGIVYDQEMYAMIEAELRVGMTQTTCKKVEANNGQTPTWHFSAKHQANTHWTKHPRADLELPNCHRHSLHDPRQRRIHLPELQQRPDVLLQFAAHLSADLELPNCHRHALQDPR